TEIAPSTPPPITTATAADSIFCSAISTSLVDTDCSVIENSPTKKEKPQKQNTLPNTPKKSTRQDTSHISYKNGKIVFSEKKLGLERHPSVVAALFNFHQLIDRVKKDTPDVLPLTSIPSEHLPLIAMIVQERDVSINFLVKSIESQLCPVVFGESSISNSDILAPGVVEATITNIAEHKNYGITLSDLQQSFCIPLDDVPTNLSIQRWEVRDLELLPEDVRNVVLKRRKARQNAHEECVQWFRSLDADILSQILSGTLKKLKITQSGSVLPEPLLSVDAAATQPSSKNPRSAKHLDSASDKQANDNKQCAHILPGQQSLQSFFSTDKNGEKSKRNLANQQSSSAEHKSYYESTFLGFHLRLNTTMYKYERPLSFDPQALDSILQTACQAQDNDTDALSLLRAFTDCGKKNFESSNLLSKRRDAEDLDEAELLQLRLLELPKKLIQFHASRRPAYWGTWSRQLKNVSGRRPFSMDTTVIDYEVDSDAEWEAEEEEEEGEELNSENDDEGDDDEDDDDDDDDEEDDDDFDEESGFIVSDHLSRSFSADSIEIDGDDDDNESGSESDSEFISENEIMEDINPEEEVCASNMDIDDLAGADNEDRAGSSSRPVRARRKVPLDQQKRNLAELREESRRSQKQRRRQLVQSLVPVAVGLAWEQADAATETITQEMLGLLEALTVSPLGNTLPLFISTDPIKTQPAQHKDSSTKTTDTASAPVGRKAKEFTQEDLSALVSIVHGSSLGVSRLVDELKQKITDASKAQIERLIHEHAVKEKRPPATRPLWYVNNDLLQQTQGERMSAKQSDPCISSDSSQANRHLSHETENIFSANSQFATTTVDTFAENAAKRQKMDNDVISD
ncbi:hypothetical protein J3B02_003823, partial [Coemansia erecta]